MAKLSLIVPVYNVERYLDEAVQSIRAQTFTDFQVVLVDDGSTDTSTAIAAQACEQDTRFTLVHQENSGPGPGGGRNGGLATANGELVMFMDSDDIIRPSMFAEMVALFDDPLPGQPTGHRNDMVTTSAERLKGVSLQRSTIHDLSHPVAQHATTASASPWLMFDSTPWNKMFRREFFDTHVGTWPAQQLYEDIVPMTTCLLRAQSIGVLTTPHYLWRVRNDGSSITQQRTGIEGDLAQIAQLCRADDVVRDFGSEDTKMWLDWKAYTYDFVWMLRKFAQLDGATARRLLQSLANAMNQLGHHVLPLLTGPMQSCVRAVIEQDLRRARLLAARHRLALVPDRRRLDTARRRPLLAATLASARPHSDGQRIVTSSPLAAGSPTLELTSSPPWVEAGEGSASVSIAPANTKRAGRQLRATFHLTADDIALVDAEQICFVQLSAQQSSGEVQRSLGDRVASRLGRSPAGSSIRRAFQGTNLVLLGEPARPYIDTVELIDEQLVFRGELGPTDHHDGFRISDVTGAFDYQGSLSQTTHRFAIEVPLRTLATSVDYYVAFTTSNNIGLPTPLSVVSNTILNEDKNGRIALQPSGYGQAVFRCNTNDFSAFSGAVRQKLARRNR